MMDLMAFWLRRRFGATGRVRPWSDEMEEAEEGRAEDGPPAVDLALGAELAPESASWAGEWMYWARLMPGSYGWAIR